MAIDHGIRAVIVAAKVNWIKFTTHPFHFSSVMKVELQLINPANCKIQSSP